MVKKKNKKAISITLSVEAMKQAEKLAKDFGSISAAIDFLLRKSKEKKIF